MASKGYIDFNNDYWCAFCGRKAPRGQERHDKLGPPTDWKCGHLLRHKRARPLEKRCARSKHVDK